MSGQGMSEIMTPLADDQLGRLALIEAIRANTDAVNRLSRHSEMTDKKLDDIIGALNQISTRVSLLESNTLKHEFEKNVREMDALDGRLRELENERQQRKGAMSLFEWFSKHWPLIALTAALTVALAVRDVL